MWGRMVHSGPQYETGRYVYTLPKRNLLSRKISRHTAAHDRLVKTFDC
jgi:hypothetical protein